jgi:putative transposase
MDLWAYTNGVILDFSRRGKPTDNAAIESFNGRFRSECLTTRVHGVKRKCRKV